VLRRFGEDWRDVSDMVRKRRTRTRMLATVLVVRTEAEVVSSKRSHRTSNQRSQAASLVISRPLSGLLVLKPEEDVAAWAPAVVREVAGC
jgi:hypothetical protein